MPERTKGQSRDQLAAIFGASGHTLENADTVVAAAERDPSLRHLKEEMDRTRRVDGVYRRLRVMQQAARIAAEPLPLPTGPFRVIVADPPWRFGDGEEGALGRRGWGPYPTMAVEAICAMPVGGLAHQDAVLWLWTTNFHLLAGAPQAVLSAWGFTGKTILTWAKDKMGTGDWLRGQTEHVVLAARGKPVITLTNQTTVLHAPAREHSRKPDEFYALVETLCPGSRVELFAREPREGWTAWGAEVPEGS